MADHTAKSIQYAPTVRKKYDSAAAFVWLLQARLVAIPKHVVTKFPSPKLPRELKPTTAELTDSLKVLTRHSWVESTEGRDTFRCTQCMATVQGRKIIKLLQNGPCVGRQLTPTYHFTRRIVHKVCVDRHELERSHALAKVKGLVYCTKCGFYATQRPRKLKEECLKSRAGGGQRTPAGKANLLAIWSGKPPANMLDWPEPNGENDAA